MALAEQLSQGIVGAVLPATGGGQQVVDGLLRLDIAQVAAAVKLAQVVMGADLTGFGSGLQVLLGF